MMGCHDFIMYDIIKYYIIIQYLDRLFELLLNDNMLLYCK